MLCLAVHEVAAEVTFPCRSEVTAKCCPIRHCVRVQVNRRLNRLIVVDGHGRLAGVCSRGDIMRATLEHFRWVKFMAEIWNGLLEVRLVLGIEQYAFLDNRGQLEPHHFQADTLQC